MRTRTLALALALAFVAGCGGNDTTPQAQPGQPLEQATVPTTDSTPLPYEVDCGGGKVIAHKPEAVPVVDAMTTSWCADEVQDVFADDTAGDETTVDDCRRFAAGAARLAELTSELPDPEMRGALQSIAGVVKGSADACVEQGNVFPLMGMSAVSGYAGVLEQRMVALGIQTVESDGATTGYHP